MFLAKTSRRKYSSRIWPPAELDRGLQKGGVPAGLDSPPQQSNGKNRDVYARMDGSTLPDRNNGFDSNGRNPSSKLTSVSMRYALGWMFFSRFNTRAVEWAAVSSASLDITPHFTPVGSRLGSRPEERESYKAQGFVKALRVSDEIIISRQADVSSAGT